MLHNGTMGLKYDVAIVCSLGTHMAGYPILFEVQHEYCLAAPFAMEGGTGDMHICQLSGSTGP